LLQAYALLVMMCVCSAAIWLEQLQFKQVLAAHTEQR